ncbi:MAG: outer membrane beta-barrel protein [Acidobacteriota bacterium]|nr:outer membrane beta-barrel protein [Acidobacteriota bacterium]
MSISKSMPVVCLVGFSLLGPGLCRAQEPHTPDVSAQTNNASSAPLTDRERMLLDRIDKLEQRLTVLEGRPSSGYPSTSQAVPSPQQPSTQSATGTSPASPTGAPAPAVASAGSNDSAFSFADGTTLNFDLDGYYGYNFNHPVGRVNLLRANDPLSNSFSLNQAVAMIERTPDATVNRRFGYRLDLMFGQQTEILQGSTANETRPQVYRNIFQAYGSYLFPVGHGLQVDFGKFASSLGLEGTYTKDQLNYSRSYFYNFLPFYHMGVRATYNLNDKLSLQYWLVNGANQTEDFNGFKSQAALITFKPNKNISWNVNYYEGQEQRDVVPLYNPGLPSLPTQPGLSTQPVNTAHNGREHIIDSYASFTLGPKWSAALEGDYVLNRVASNSPPQRAYGGAGYLHKQLTSALALNGRFEYLADRGGLFSGINQDLKDVTVTGVYQFTDGFQTRLEYRRDFSNVPFFLTNNPLIFSGSQNSLTLGMLWWFGGKQGSW